MLDETQFEKLLISLEANTSKLDTQIVKSSSLLDKQLAAMETRTTTFSSRMEKQFEKAFGPQLGKGLGAALDQGSAALSRYASNLGPLGAVLQTVGGGWLAAGAAAGGFAYLLEQGTEKLAVHERLLATVAGVLRATGAASGQTADSIEAMGERISESTLQTRDSVLQAATELLTFRNIAPESFEPTLKYAADLAQVFGIDLATAAKQLGKALDEPAQGLAALRRFGVTFTSDQEALIKKFAETGDVARADGVILDALKDKIGGAGASAHTGLSGATHDLGEAWDRLLIAMASGPGTLVVRSIEAVTAAVNGLNAAIKGAGAGIHLIAELATGDYTGILKAGGLDTSPARIPGQEYRTGKTDMASVMAMFGPGIAGDQRASALAGAVSDVVQTMKDKAAELKKTPLAQEIDKALSEAAEKAHVPVSEFAPGGKFAAQGAEIRSIATEEYNLAQARKDGKKAAEAAKEAERKALEAQKKALAALSEEAKQAQSAFKIIDELTNKLSGASGKPGAERAAYIADQVGRLPEGQSYLSGTVSSLAGQEFDAHALEEQINKGRDLVRNYQDQTNALQADRAAAEADKFEHDALIEIYQKTGTVSADAAAAIAKQKQAILDAGHAAEQATEIYREQVEMTDRLREGLDRMAETGAKGFKGLRQATQEFLQQLAELIIKLYVMGPILEQLFGKQGTAGGGALGGLFGSLFGSSSSGFGETGSYQVNGLTVPQLGSDSGGFFSSIASLFGFAEGGRVGGRGNRDTVLARLTPGEYVMNRSAVRSHGALLEALNGGTAFAAGGPVGRVSIPRLPQISVPRTAASTLALSNTIHIDAKGAELGVEAKIADAIRAAVPDINAAALRQFDYLFPKKLSDTLRDRA